MKIVACPSCNQIVKISDETQFCPQCVQYMKKPPPPRKNYLGVLYAAIFVIVAIIVTIYMVVWDKPKSAQSAYQAPAKPTIYSLFSAKINKFTVGEYNNYEIVGEVKNISSRPFRFVHVKIIFYDSKGNIVGEDTTYACLHSKGDEFEAVIPKEKRNLFPEISSFTNQVLLVTGFLEEFRGIPQIMVFFPRQIVRSQ